MSLNDACAGAQASALIYRRLNRDAWGESAHLLEDAEETEGAVALRRTGATGTLGGTVSGVLLLLAPLPRAP